MVKHKTNLFISNNTACVKYYFLGAKSDADYKANSSAARWSSEVFGKRDFYLSLTSTSGTYISFVVAAALVAWVWVPGLGVNTTIFFDVPGRK